MTFVVHKSSLAIWISVRRAALKSRQAAQCPHCQRWTCLRLHLMPFFSLQCPGEHYGRNEKLNFNWVQKKICDCGESTMTICFMRDKRILQTIWERCELVFLKEGEFLCPSDRIKSSFVWWINHFIAAIVSSLCSFLCGSLLFNLSLS